MAQPTRSGVHVDAILTNFSVAYIQNQSHFIANQVFPTVRVQKQSDKYFVYKKEDWFRDEAKRRPDATESAGSGYNLDTDTYSADVWAFHKDVGDQVLQNADAPLDMFRDAATFVTQRLLLRQEVQWVTDYFKASVWGQDYTGVNSGATTNQFVRWNDYSTSDPIEDIEAGKEKILSTTGFMPNTLVLGYSVFRQLKHHPDIVDRIKYTSAENITESMLAALFEVDRVLVAKAIQNTADEGAVGSYSFTHGKHAWLGYVNPSPGILSPSAGYVFAWDGVSDGMGQNIGISRFRMDELRAERVEGQVAFDNKLVATDLGVFFATAVA